MTEPVAPPHSIEAEQQLLGAILANNDRYHEVSSIVRAEHFFDPVHADIWRKLAGRIEAEHLAGAVALGADMDQHEGLNVLGGKKYLVNLVGGSISGNAVKDYARIVIDMHDRRELMGRVLQIGEELGGGKSASDAAAELELMLHARQDASDDPRSMSLLKAMSRSLSRMSEIYQGGSIGVPTGLTLLDDALTLAPGRFTLLGGSTSMGKTGLALWIAYHAAKCGYGVGFDSIEMPEEDLANRLNSIESEIPYKAYDRPMSETLFRKVFETTKNMEALPIEIFSADVRDVPSILSEGKRLHRKFQPNGEFKGFQLLIVDYIQLVRGRGENDFSRLSRVANDMKQVAKSLGVHVLALAQVDRKLLQDVESRPNLSHLRGSGDLENAPDNVLFIHRPEYFYERNPRPTKTDDLMDFLAEWERWKGKAELIIGKARMGEVGSIKVGCDLATNRFFDLAENVAQEDMGF